MRDQLRPPRRLLAAALLIGLGVAAASCDRGTPVAPTGAQLSATANPSHIGVHGTSNITIVLMRANGVPVTPGTEVRLSTTLGTLPDIVTTDSRGMAQATLQAGDRAGVARVTASSGTVQSAELEVLIGFRPGTLILEAEPREIGLRGGTTRLTARVLDEEGASLSGVPVTFASPAGSFTTNPVSTDEQGRAATDLVLSEDDVAFLGGDELEVAAEATAAGATATGVVRIRVQRRLEASFTMTTDGLKVIFRDTSTGQPRDWYWSFGDGRSRSTQHPTHEYHGPGTYTVTLYVWNAEQEDRVSQFVTVSR